MRRRRTSPDYTMRAQKPPAHLARDMKTNVSLRCGWGRLIFGQTFDDVEAAAGLLRSEEVGKRDICMYLRDPHVAVGRAPGELFIDPSHTYRLWLHTYQPRRHRTPGVIVRKMQSSRDADQTNRMYAALGMVTAPTEVIWGNQRTRSFTYLIAEDADTGRIIGTITGIDHVNAFDDPEGGASFWCLAVDPQSSKPGVGEMLVRTLAEKYKARGRAYLDCSVLADNRPAIGLYEKLGFQRVPVFAVKRKNPINEPLFSGPPSPGFEDLNPYARIIADEALRRGIAVEVLDAQAGFLRLTFGGRSIVTRESLSEMTTAVAMSRCDDKRVTRRICERAGIRVARGREGTFDDEDVTFLHEEGRVVVKPARGEQGMGITVDVRDPEHLKRALEAARQHCPEVLIEELIEGKDLRIVVIDHEVVAAAVREPATVVGNGHDTIADLIEAQSRRREAATGGESRIPVDEITVDVVREVGYEMDGVLPAGERLAVRKTANLHTGGTIHDVTAELHPDLARAASRVSELLDIPVTGLDFIVPDVRGTEYVMIEANERPGLANHEPRPTAQRFIDLLFPATREIPSGWGPPRPTDQSVGDV